MFPGATVLLAAFQVAAGSPPPLEAILSRVSEEAEVFQYQSVNVVGQETLRHRSRKNPSRFRLRAGEAGTQRPPVTYQTREIVSEYGFAALKEAPEALREFRQVVSVDGRRVLSPEKARTTLAMNMRSSDDRARRTMLQEFEKHGMAGAATDFGQLVLLFRRALLVNYDFAITGAANIGADPVWTVHYKQKAGPDAMRVFHDGKLEIVLMEGDLVVRQSDFVPVRVTMQAWLMEDGVKAVHNASVEYANHRSGVLLPQSVVYTRTAGGELMIENRYSYAGYKMFKAEAEIKFTFEDEPAPSPKP